MASAAAAAPVQKAVGTGHRGRGLDTMVVPAPSLRRRGEEQQDWFSWIRAGNTGGGCGFRLLFGDGSVSSGPDALGFTAVTGCDTRKSFVALDSVFLP